MTLNKGGLGGVRSGGLGFSYQYEADRIRPCPRLERTVMVLECGVFQKVHAPKI